MAGRRITSHDHGIKVPVLHLHVARCGTQLTFQHVASPTEVGITASSLDDPSLVPPRERGLAVSLARPIA